MNKPTFRAWDKLNKFMMPVENIDFKTKLINVGGVWRFFDEIILMQSTGVKDKNGVEIFDKEAVEGFYGGTYVKGIIQFIDGCYCLQRIGDFPAICLFEVDNRNILGNIHENPELLNEVRNSNEY